MKVVHYVKQYGMFNVGETSGVSDDEAKALVARGIATETNIAYKGPERSGDLDPPEKPLPVRRAEEAARGTRV